MITCCVTPSNTGIWKLLIQRLFFSTQYPVFAASIKRMWHIPKPIQTPTFPRQTSAWAFLIVTLSFERDMDISVRFFSSHSLCSCVRRSQFGCTVFRHLQLKDRQHSILETPYSWACLSVTYSISVWNINSVLIPFLSPKIFYCSSQPDTFGWNSSASESSLQKYSVSCLACVQCRSSSGFIRDKGRGCISLALSSYRTATAAPSNGIICFAASGWLLQNIPRITQISFALSFRFFPSVPLLCPTSHISEFQRLDRV